MPRAHLEPTRLLTIADLAPEHDLPLLLEAFASLAHWNPAARLIIVGEGPERTALEQQILDAGLGDVVGLPGRLPAPRLVELMQRAHVFVLPCRDGCPQTVPPALPVAMAGGLCIVASDVGPVSRLLTDGVDGLLVPPGDESQLLRALHLAVDNDALRAKLGLNAALGIRGALMSA